MSKRPRRLSALDHVRVYKWLESHKAEYDGKPVVWATLLERIEKETGIRVARTMIRKLGLELGYISAGRGGDRVSSQKEKLAALEKKVEALAKLVVKMANDLGVDVPDDVASQTED